MSNPILKQAIVIGAGIGGLWTYEVFDQPASTFNLV
jgi:hypothetical protein